MAPDQKPSNVSFQRTRQSAVFREAVLYFAAQCQSGRAAEFGVGQEDDMTRSSWLDNEKTVYEYSLADGSTWIVQNEFQPVECPHCRKKQFQRLTHIWHLDPQGRCTPEYHINRNVDFETLKQLLISYTDQSVGISEVEENGEWVLKAGDRIIARQVKKH